MSGMYIQIALDICSKYVILSPLSTYKCDIVLRQISTLSPLNCGVSSPAMLKCFFLREYYEWALSAISLKGCFIYVVVDIPEYLPMPTSYMYFMFVIIYAHL